jgi:cation diffusion facilitator CzcD-associated flavoprotein CzcO
LTRDELADQVKRFATEFHIRILHRTTVTAAKYDSQNKLWSLKILHEDSKKALSCKHLVLATGSGFQGAYRPEIPGRAEYTGINIHSTDYKNAKQLVARGVKVSIDLEFDPFSLSHYIQLLTFVSPY